MYDGWHEIFQKISLIAVLIIGVAVLGYVIVRLLDPIANALIQNAGGLILLIAGYLWLRKRGWLR